MDDVTNKPSLQQQWGSSHLAGGNAAYLEQLYESYLRDPSSIDPAWRNYFETLPRVNGALHDVSHATVRENFRQLALRRVRSAARQVRPAPRCGCCN